MRYAIIENDPRRNQEREITSFEREYHAKEEATRLTRRNPGISYQVRPIGTAPELCNVCHKHGCHDNRHKTETR